MKRAEPCGIPWLARGWQPPAPKPEPMMTHEFPLRPGMFARFTLPIGLTRADADRLVRFVNVLAFDRRVAS